MRNTTLKGDAIVAPVGQKAIVLLSGGLDSAVTALMARSQGFLLYTLTIDYGQRHRSEVQAAKRLAHQIQAARHLLIPVDLRSIGGSALTDDISVPKNTEGHEELKRASCDIPVTYVPARNTVFLSLALGYAEVVGARDIFIGANAIDYSGYPDCRPEFLRAFENLANLATKAGVGGEPFRVHAPLIDKTKAQIIREGARLGLDFSLTQSCYDPVMPGSLACGSCDSCRIRQRGFRDAGVPDPTPYATKAK